MKNEDFDAEMKADQLRYWQSCPASERTYGGGATEAVGEAEKIRQPKYKTSASVTFQTVPKERHAQVHTSQRSRAGNLP